jgi:hypothetical protein
MSKRQVYFVKAASAGEALVDVGIETIGTGWPGRLLELWMTDKTAVYHQHKRFKVVCTYRKLPTK